MNKPLSPFLQDCIDIVRLQVERYNAATDKTHRQHLRRMISVTIRNLTDHPEFGTSMSKAAKSLADSLGIPLQEMTYDTQPKWDKGRQLFAYEHMVPVKNLMYACIADPTKVAEVLQSAKIVWVTRPENFRLNDLGYSHNRPDPAKCYEEAGIVLAV
jgi:hypothetical protein